MMRRGRATDTKRANTPVGGANKAQGGCRAAPRAESTRTMNFRSIPDVRVFAATG